MRRTGNNSDIAIVVLNWNGWRDTLECLTSLTDSARQNFKIVLIDNGSTDSSLEKIRSWSRGELPVSIGPLYGKKKRMRLNLIEYDLSEISETSRPNQLSQEERKSDVVLIKSRVNLGFAKGCNVGIRYALQHNFEKILLLNNDTVVDSDCLRILSEFLDRNRTYGIVTPKIFYYDQPDKIWNCGGRLTFTGSRKYYCKDRNDDGCTQNEMMDITFITGCALLARTDIFKRYGLLTEKFFFGEEDYEFSLRMKKNKVKMAAVLSTKVYHKVGISQNGVFDQNALAKAFIFYLNRFVDLRLYYRNLYWKIWRVASFGYILPLLKITYGVPLNKLYQFSSLLLQYSQTHDGVGENDFFNAKKILD